MAVLLSETQFKTLQGLTAKLQSLTPEEGEVSAIIDEIHEILANVEIDRDYREAIVDRHVLITKGDSYIV